MRLSHASLFSLAIVPMLLGVAPDVQPETPPVESHRGIEYRGAAGFFTLGKMTVVYPAGPGEPVGVNRRSADARARWLASVYKNKVEVVADNQLTEEQKNGNLLLLGWNNRFFGAPGPARPFTHDANGTSFLGIREDDPNRDLLVFHRNPLNWSSFILFWSRIDPERDRFQVLPRVGSDWVIYRDYGATRQGMFVPARKWLPARDKLAEADLTKELILRPGGTGMFDSEHFHIIYDRTEFQAREVSGIAQDREAALAKAVAAIGPTPREFRIQLFLYKDADDKQTATGVPDMTHTIAGNREIHATRAYALSSSAREEMHVLARDIYGTSVLTSIHDGLALSVENSFRGQTMAENAGRLRAANKLAGINDILDEESFRMLPPEIAAPTAGAFMTWLRETYGPDGVRKSYVLTEGTPAALAAALGSTPEAVSASFLTWADGKAAAVRKQIDFEAAQLEAQQKYGAKDWIGMTAALRKALQAKPGDPQTLFNLASAQMRAENFEDAASSLKELLAAPLAQDDSRFRIFGHLQLGRVYDLEGRRAEALVEYDAVLALPDEHGAHASALERKASPATREQLQ